jgi:predicted metal-dependent phosphoesterase TrpH
MIRADLHVHTDTSPDSLLPPQVLVAVCQRQGLDCVAVTDHNQLRGALKVAETAPPGLRVIVGEEIRTAEGEVLAFFIREEIPPGLDVFDTAQRIRSQGGLVGVPHPLDSWGRALPDQALQALHRAGLLDFIEGRNGRVVWERDNRRAEELGRRLGLPMTAGSDAHSRGEVGRCYVLLPTFDGPESFLAALAEGMLVGRRSRLWVKFNSIGARLWRSLGRR